MRHVGLIATVLVLTAACAEGLTLGQTTSILRDDAAVLSRIELDGKTTALTADRSGCPQGTGRSVYTMTGDMPQGAEAAVTSTLASEFHTMGYQEAEGPHAQFGVNVSVLRKESLGIVFTVTLRTRKPNVEISGKTDCLPG
ncbi:hypothetical protein [Sphaerisporangium corydalis]|uniref:Uncharacterized protein n=1 Tax=Sphaerisporangium corydalis TaxID=1441875 RepID=A0ABV9EQR3_9ACTN|nr:hypothetical protein [Sphaerisporangium corydalis]